MPSSFEKHKYEYWAGGFGSRWKSDDCYGVTGGDFSTPYRYERSRGRSYHVMRNTLEGYTSYPDCYWSTGNGKFDFGDSALQPVKNRAYANFIDKVNGSTSSLGAFAAEWKESLGTVTKRTHGLYQAYRHLRRGDFRRALKSLSVEPKRKHKSKVRNTANEASGLWLEYWFGWAPSVSDISNACLQLSEPLPSGRFQAGASDSLRRKTPKGGWGAYYDVQCQAKVRVGAICTLENPNLYLAQQMGILNPLQVAWEVVPFSFLVDWAFDIGSFLGSFTDLAGVSVSKPYWNLKLVNRFKGYHGYYNVGNPSNIVHHDFQRYVGLPRPMPNLQVRANLGNSLTRAASAVSLLTQVLKT